MKFSFVLLTWNRYQFLDKCLQALAGSIDDVQNCEVIVLDNGSTDLTPKILDSFKGLPNFKVIREKRNRGIQAYTRLFKRARGEYIVVVDDDVLELPPHVDAIFTDYMHVFPEYGYIALNVVQNEFTNGAKPGAEMYVEEHRDGRVLECGPTGGWFSCFRRKDYRKLWFKTLFAKFSMSNGEDSFLSANLEAYLSLKSGIIRDSVCFHATGPYYASQYGHLDREIEKYNASNLQSLAEFYKDQLK